MLILFCLIIHILYIIYIIIYVYNDITSDKLNDDFFLQILSKIYSDDIISNSIEALEYSRPGDILSLVDIKSNTNNIYNVIMCKKEDNKSSDIIYSFLLRLGNNFSENYSLSISKNMIPNDFILHNISYESLKYSKNLECLSLNKIKLRDKFISNQKISIKNKIDEIKRNTKYKN